jgi:hypothetical protein
LRSRRHPALQPALRDVEQEHQPVFATGAHINGDLLRMRTIYITAGSLSRRFSVACTAKQQQAVPTSDLIG